jgi:hypothetical protein
MLIQNARHNICKIKNIIIIPYDIKVFLFNYNLLQCLNEHKRNQKNPFEFAV